MNFQESINVAKRIAQDNAIEPSANAIRLNDIIRQNGIKPQYTQESPKELEEQESPVICIQKTTDNGEVRSASRDQDFDFMVMINEDNKIATNSNSNNNCDNDNAQNLVKVENDSSSSTCDSTSSSSQK